MEETLDFSNGLLRFSGSSSYQKYVLITHDSVSISFIYLLGTEDNDKYFTFSIVTEVIADTKFSVVLGDVKKNIDSNALS